MMQRSIAYYPEYFSEAEWDRDFAGIAAAGLQAVRFGEFAWSRLEPEEGRYDFTVLERGIEAAARHGLSVILCTPTACPPIWLASKYPDSLPVDQWGRRTRFGARQHRCYNAPPYQKAAAALVAALGRRFGANPHIIGWQIDNELAGEQKKCFCPHCRAAFQAFLRQRYGSIEAMNSRQGNRFWSQEYQEFTQVEPPSQFAMDLYIWNNPSMNLDFIRFSSDSITAFCRMQERLLRRYVPAGVPITTNTDDFHYGDTLDLFALYKTLDVGAFDCYSEKEYEFAFYCDFLRGVKQADSFWVLESGDDNPILTRLMALAEERGCTAYSIFKYRPFPWGQEQGRASLIDLAGNPMPNYAAVREYGQGAPRPRLPKAKLGLLYDFESSWAYNAKSLMLNVFDGLSYPQYLLHTVYKALFTAGLHTDILSDESDPFTYDCLVVPRHILYNPGLESRLLAFVEQGGSLICDTELFLKNSDNVFLEQAPPLYAALFGRSTACFDADIKEPLEVSFGKGRAWLCQSAQSEEGWGKLLRKLP